MLQLHWTSMFSKQATLFISHDIAHIVHSPWNAYHFTSFPGDCLLLSPLKKECPPLCRQHSLISRGKYYILCASPVSYHIILSHFLILLFTLLLFLNFCVKTYQDLWWKKDGHSFHETGLYSRLFYLTEVCVEISKLTSIGKRYTQYYPAPENPQGF